MSGNVPNAMPPLPRAPKGLPANIAAAWNQLVSALEIQVRRMLAPPTLWTVAGPLTATTFTGNVGAVASAGNTQGTAAPLPYFFNVVSGSDGVVLPSAPGEILAIFNGAGTPSLYAPGAGLIYGAGGSGSPVTLAANTLYLCTGVDAADWAYK